MSNVMSATRPLAKKSELPLWIKNVLGRSPNRPSAVTTYRVLALWAFGCTLLIGKYSGVGLALLAIWYKCAVLWIDHNDGWNIKAPENPAAFS